MKKLATFASVALLAAAGQASATVYSILGTNSEGVNYAYNQTPGPGAVIAGNGVVDGFWDATGSGAPVFTGGAFADASVNFSGATVPVFVLGGTYDDVAGAGSWDLAIDLTGFGSGQQALLVTTQTFTLSADGTTGTLDQAANCDGDFGGCLGLAPGFQGPFSTATGAVVAGENTFQFFSANLGGQVPFEVTLTPEVPVPAAAWLFGSALVGLAGVARRRK